MCRLDMFGVIHGYPPAPSDDPWGPAASRIWGGRRGMRSRGDCVALCSWSLASGDSAYSLCRLSTAMLESKLRHCVSRWPHRKLRLVRVIRSVWDVEGGPEGNDWPGVCIPWWIRWISFTLFPRSDEVRVFPIPTIFTSVVLTVSYS